MTPREALTPLEALERILEIAYAGHPDGREMRLEMIRRYAQAALDNLKKEA